MPDRSGNFPDSFYITNYDANALPSNAFDIESEESNDNSHIPLLIIEDDLDETYPDDDEIAQYINEMVLPDSSSDESSQNNELFPESDDEDTPYYHDLIALAWVLRHRNAFHQGLFTNF